MMDRLYSLRSFILVGLALAWPAGIFLDSLLHISSFVLIGCVALASLCIVLLYHSFQGRTAMLLVLCLFAGAWRYSSMLPENDAQALSTFISLTPISIRGTVADEPKLEGRARVLIVEAAMLSRDARTNWMLVHGKVEVQIVGTEVEDRYGANYGDSVELRGKLQEASAYTPPGVFTRMMFPRVRVTSDIKNIGSSTINFLYHMRSTFATLMLQVLPQPAASLLVAIVLGLRTPGLTPLKFAFNVTGTAHLIAPSGFKVTILAGLVISGTRWLYQVRFPGLTTRRKQQQWQHWTVTTLVLVSIVAYTIVSGAGPAAIRAGIMGSLLVLAPRIGRNYNVYTALALSSTLMSGIDPFVLWDTGFQLSFLGTLGIVLLTPHFEAWLSILKTLPSGHTICEMIAVTLAAQTATLPIFATTFQQISFIAPLANLLTVPLLGIFIALGIMICGIGLVSLPLAQVCGWIAWPLLTYVINCILQCAALPGAYLSVTEFNSGLTWAYYAVLACGMSFLLRRRPGDQKEIQGHPSTRSTKKHTWQFLQWSAACLCIGATGIAILWPHGTGRLSITFLDVGPAGEPAQGEAIFIRTAENKTVLIDGGMDAISLGQALDNRLAYWQRSLDMVILTTPRNDHLGGLQDVITRYQVGSI
ncbi:MAG: ComEC/Rec2 family competence protein, partial [Ktedonobacteraceae bacterium]|nr:ComEC/Rec2 family competence protein [Ktedonobacteraceae bacterium]